MTTVVEPVRDVLQNLSPNGAEIATPQYHEEYAFRVDTGKGTRLIKVGRYKDHWSARVDDYSKKTVKTFTRAGNPELLGHALNGFLHATLLGYEH